MTKNYKLQNLDCANCAAKMENAISKLDGVQTVSINFMTQKLVLQADDDMFYNIIEEAVLACKKIEPDCKIII